MVEAPGIVSIVVLIVAVFRVWNAVIGLGTSRESRFREAGRALIGRALKPRLAAWF
jgi:hypothetical protein